jgi:hypothetical protein
MHIHSQTKSLIPTLDRFLTPLNVCNVPSPRRCWMRSLMTSSRCSRIGRSSRRRIGRSNRRLNRLHVPGHLLLVLYIVSVTR